MRHIKKHKDSTIKMEDINVITVRRVRKKKQERERENTAERKSEGDGDLGQRGCDEAETGRAEQMSRAKVFCLHVCACVCDWSFTSI